MQFINNKKPLISGAATLLAAFLSFNVVAQSNLDTAAQGNAEATYQTFCAGCHNGSLLEAPRRAAFESYTPKRIVDALEFGVMAVQGMPLSREDKRQVASLLTGEEYADRVTSLESFSCSTNRPVGEALTEAVRWNGWGQSKNNARHQASETLLDKSNVDRLALKWSFAFPETTRVRSQPVVTPEVVFIGSQEGSIYALDSSNGCPWWHFKAGAEVRGAIYVESDSNGVPQTLMFGDFTANAYALDAQTGDLLWKTKVHDHSMATITGSVVAHDGVLVVPVSSLEIIAASRPEYECCTFRGAVVGIDMATGEMLWRTYTTPEPRETIRNAIGTQLQGPSGAPSWSGPSIDVKRGLVYATTGQNYSSPATDTSDAILALDLKSGAVQWITQVTPNDAWNGACSRGTTNCPEEDGPDYDVGASVIVAETSSGRDLLLVGQKSGITYALDPDDDGAIVWQQRVGSGGTMGGVHHGMSTDGERLYVGVYDLPTNNPYNVGPNRPGMNSLDIETGEILWHTELPNICEQTRFLCYPGISAPISTTPGLIYAGGVDGMLRIFDTENGDILWEENTRRSFGEVNGIPATGGSIEMDGPVIADGNLYITSGYEKWNETPGNVLLVYSLNGE